MARFATNTEEQYKKDYNALGTFLGIARWAKFVLDELHPQTKQAMKDKIIEELIKAYDEWNEKVAEEVK